MTDTSGFYKPDGNVLIHAPNSVHGPNDFVLERVLKDNYQYPADGWQWFDNMEDAYTANGLQIPEQPTERNNPRRNAGPATTE